MQLDSMPVGPQPIATVLVEGVTGSVVHDDENLSRRISRYELLQEAQKRASVEVLRESIAEAGVVERDRTVHMRRLALAECVYSRLLSNS